MQLADFLAGIARKIASDELNGLDDPALTALLRPYTGPRAVWGRRAQLGPARAGDGNGGTPYGAQLRSLDCSLTVAHLHHASTGAAP